MSWEFIFFLFGVTTLLEDDRDAETPASAPLTAPSTKDLGPARTVEHPHGGLLTRLAVFFKQLICQSQILDSLVHQQFHLQESQWIKRTHFQL